MPADKENAHKAAVAVRDANGDLNVLPLVAVHVSFLFVQPWSVVLWKLERVVIAEKVWGKEKGRKKEGMRKGMGSG